jgi:hypothetical protein
VADVWLEGFGGCWRGDDAQRVVVAGFRTRLVRIQGRWKDAAQTRVFTRAELVAGWEASDDEVLLG